MVDFNQDQYIPDEKQTDSVPVHDNPPEQLDSDEAAFEANMKINQEDERALPQAEESNLSANREDEVDREFAGLIDPDAVADHEFSPIRSAENRDQDTEFAADLATDTSLQAEEEENDVNTRGQTFGWFGLALAIASMFIWPVVLAPVGAVLGFAAWTQGSRALGVWAIVLGVISFVTFLAIAPNYS